MSRFFSEKFSGLTPYTPGEQPRERRYIKLNTNESPFPPSPAVIRAAEAAISEGQLYSDPECLSIRKALAERYELDVSEVLATNGSDEALNFAFMAFCDDDHPAVFPDITYGFYKVFSEVNRIPYRIIPLEDDFSVSSEVFCRTKGTIFIANPNAPTGMLLPLGELEKIIASDRSRVVVVDEAYVDFGGESALTLIPKYDNLLVTGTFSKSRSLAGARLGFAFGQASLIRDLDTLRNSTNPYNVNRMTMAAGVASLSEDEINLAHVRQVIQTRDSTAERLSRMGFTLTPSRANFLFARHPGLSGGELYLKLKESGILVRHFSPPRIAEYNRITVGSEEDMKALISALETILGRIK